MKGSKVKIFEFLTLFTICVGTVIGSGIYMKNNALLLATGNPIIAIVIWAFVGLSCIAAVYVFVEIASSTKTHGNGTASNWTKLFVNRKTASIFAILYVLIYVPSSQTIFAAGFTMYLFAAIGKPLSSSTQFSIMLVVGIIILIGFAILNAFKYKWADRFHIYTTIFKFIPMILSLIAGFIVAGTQDGAMWNNGDFAGSTSAGAWNTNSFNADSFIRGFGPILFAFDGFIFVANKQKTVKNKEVVAGALMAGMAFIAAFYVLMAISLFLGSPDGSIEKLLERVFSGDSGTVLIGAATAARIISNICLMVICLQGINIFYMVGIRGLESDANAKLMYSKKRNFDYVKSALFQATGSIIIFIFFLTLGFLVTKGEFGPTISLNYDKFWTIYGGDKSSDVIKQAFLQYSMNQITFFTGVMSSTAGGMGFMIVTVLLCAAIVNRFTNKVKTERVKLFMFAAIPATICFAAFFILALYGFIIPPKVLSGEESWTGGSAEGMWFTIIMIVSIVIIAIYYFYQERKFKRDPFLNGFEGEIIPSERKGFISFEKFKINKDNNK